MKSFLLIICLLASTIAVQAQFDVLSESPAIKSTKGGGDRALLLLKNGNTFYFHLTISGADVRIYDSTYKQISIKHLKPELGKFSACFAIAYFEVNGDPTIFFRSISEKKVTLYRLVIDGETGALKDQEQISAVNEHNYLTNFAVGFGGVPSPGFFVKRMPDTDDYVVITRNSLEEDRNKRVKLTVYDKNHKEINNVFCTSPDEKYKYIEDIDLVLPGQDKIFLLAYGYNTVRSGGKECELILGEMNKTDDKLVLNEMRSSKRPPEYTAVRYNPGSKKIMLLSGMAPYSPHDAILIDPFEKKVSDLLTKRKFDDDLSIQEVVFDQNGTFSLVFEDILTSIDRTPPQTTPGVAGMVRPRPCLLKDIYIITFDASGKETMQYRIRRLQESKYFDKTRPLFKEDAMRFSLFNFSYFERNGDKYILLNDLAENLEKTAANKKPEKAKSISDCEAIVYKIKNGEPALEGKVVFKERTKNEYQKIFFDLNSYDPRRNIYVTLKMSDNDDDAVTKIVWLKP